MKNIFFVKAPLAGGGKHLINLISLDKNINQYAGKNLTKTQWFEFLKDYYLSKTKNAHAAGGEIISDPSWPNEIKTMIDVSDSVHVGHAASFDWAKTTLDGLKNKKFILLTFNSPESRRILKIREKYLYNTTTLGNAYYLEELTHFYNLPFFDDNHDYDEINLLIEVEKIFSDNIIPVIDQINNHYKINIPSGQAQILHNLWITKQKEIFYNK